MNTKQLAEQLDGSEYPLDTDDAKTWAEHGLVVIHPYSDDNMEFDGAIREEVGCYEGGATFLGIDGAIGIDDYGDLFNPPITPEEVLDLAKKLARSVKITAIWSNTSQHPSWTYEVPIAHEKFNLMEDGTVIAVCAVFSINDLPAA
jgi:hypothetical protein